MRFISIHRIAIRSFVLFLLIICLINCNDTETFFSEKRELPEKWGKDTKNEFEFEIKDTAKAYNILIPISVKEDYPFANLYLITQFQDPENREIVDTLNYPVSFPDGNPIGQKSGEDYDFFLIFRENFKFITKGKYKISITHGMRDNPLSGVNEIGLNIEQTKTKPIASK